MNQDNLHGIRGLWFVAGRIQLHNDIVYVFHVLSNNANGDSIRDGAVFNNRVRRQQPQGVDHGGIIGFIFVGDSDIHGSG